ncbi:hypothetical protein TW95_gp1420 [Pandoravirus inopinatum]|uniref:Uncharacterized protein n=1 Tax=Pandoravirus inopinatum TaxID=1605721 RepID=A0A0B5J3L7_9VIRU|nr:hypothetical protein TW95_gp1420 [Pandoravirus inopinatum]AJF98154.1 hypothetical protein [Pandoravirus inopinatum]
MTAVALVPIMMHCQWEAGAGLQSVSVNGVTYVVEPSAGAVRLADDDGRLWECGSGGRWWHMGPLDGSRDPTSAYDDGGISTTTVACWDQTVDVVWTNDTQGRTWAAPRKGGADWSPCDPASGASAAGPPPAVPINAAAAAHDIARGRASVAAAASALQGGSVAPIAAATKNNKQTTMPWWPSRRTRPADGGLHVFFFFGHNSCRCPLLHPSFGRVARACAAAAQPFSCRPHLRRRPTLCIAA